MRFVTYRTVETEPRLGLLHDGLVIDVEYFGDAIGQDLPSTMLDFIDLGPVALRFLQEAIAGATTVDLIGTSLPEGNVALLAPIPRPRRKIF
ncbi:MAG: FAA hydrolase family protein, partial [Sphingopyxis sp.]|nr:FAA hydrolase family protein [Sphingopyxis sp.]